MDPRAPVFAPVTMTTLPVKSGISSTENLDFGGKDSESKEGTRPIIKGYGLKVVVA